MKRFVCLMVVLLFIVATLFSGCSTAKVEKEPIKIGFIGPLTGTNAKPGKSMRQGMELAIEEINKAGGVNGCELIGIYEDDETNPTKGKAVAEKLVNKDEVDLVIGSYSSASVLSHMEVTKNGKVPQIVSAATGIKITESGNDWIFRNVATNPMQVNQLADYVFKNYVFKKYAMIFENTDYGKGIAEVFKAAVIDKGFEVVAFETYNPGDTDFYAQLTKIKELNPDILVLGSNITEGSQIVRQARETGINCQLAGFGGLSTPEFDELVNGANEGMIVTSYFESETSNELAKAFIKAYKEKFNEDPDMFAASNYEAIYIAKDAMVKAGEDMKDREQWRTAVRDQLKIFKDVPGVQGPTTFDEKGQADKKVFIVQWTGHKKVILQGQ